MRQPLFLMFFLLATTIARGGLAERNLVLSLHELNGSLDSRWDCQAPLTMQGLSPSYVGSGLDVPALTPSQSLALTNPIGPNGPNSATRTNNWTLVMDLHIPSGSSGARALLQTDVNNSNNADLFLGSDNRLRLYGPSGQGSVSLSNPLAAGVTYRIGFATSYNGLVGNVTLRTYVNGSLTSTVATPTNGRVTLGEELLLFSDNNGETGPLRLQSLAFWGRTLNNADLTAIGAFDGLEINWANMTTHGLCLPLPTITGDLLFGDFLTQFTPDPQAILASVRAPTTAEGRASATIALGADGGTVPGAPNHRFGGNLNVEILVDGSVRAIAGGGSLQFTGGGPDRQTVAGVTFRRGFILLTPDGLIAEGVEVLLPAGFAVSQNPLGRVRRARVVVGPVPLGEGLIPETVTLTSTTFFGEAATLMYPMGDRIPVRFATEEIVWTPQNGRFTFSQAESVVLQQKDEPQLLLLAFARARTLPGAEEFASNNFHFLGAREATAPIVIGASSGGSATMRQVHMTLDPTKFGQNSLSIRTHYPELDIAWTDAEESRIQYTNNNIDRANSQLAGSAPTAMRYARGIAPLDCNGEEGETVTDENIFALPQDGRWGFTLDGGLRAPCELRVNPFLTAGIDIEWGGYLKGETEHFTHQVTTPFQNGVVMTGGIHARNNAIPLPQHQRAAALALTGHGDDFVEVPGSDAYEEGLADYPGINLRCDDGCTARSRLADQLIDPDYPLLPTSKYLLRPAGLTGLHLSASSDPITFTAYCGADFELTALNLSFLDGENHDSGVNGRMGIPAPANFELEFEKLAFGAQGQLQTAGIAPGQNPITLAAWSFNFEPLGLEFPQPKTCDPVPGPGDGFPQITSSATIHTLTNEPLVGPLGFCFGNILAESDPEAGGHAPISRFATSSNLVINGPNSEDWQVNPMTGISLNKHEPGDWTAAVSVGGLMDLPFFVDLPVVLHSDANNLSETFTPVQYVRQTWEDLDLQIYDDVHRGLPPGVDIKTYRGLDEAGSITWDPVVERDWQLGVNFRLPVDLGVDGIFRASEVEPGDVFLFRLSKSVKRITPSTAEITFDGDLELSLANLIAQVNVNSLLAGLDLPALDSLAEQGIAGALAGVTNLDAVLTDQLQDLLEPALADVVSGAVGQQELNALAQASPEDRAALIDGYLINLSPGVENLPAGGLLTTLHDRVEEARMGMGDLLNLVEDITSASSLAAAISAEVGGEGLASQDDLDDALEPARALLTQVITQLEEVEAALTEDEIGSFLEATIHPTIHPTIQLALDDLKDTWAPQGSDFFNGATEEQFRADLVAVLSDRLGASDFSSGALTLLRQYLGDPQALARQAIDDVLATVESEVTRALTDAAGRAEGLGAMTGFMAAARLRGYARINGDSLHELRLDGRAELKLTEGMEVAVDAWYVFRNLESATPGTSLNAVDECLKDGGTSAEIEVGAAADIDWGGREIGASFGSKVGLDESGSPVSMSGDFALSGDIGVSDVSISDIKLGLGAGSNNAYFYGRGTGTLKNVTITAGFFAGLTCDPAIVAYADEEIGALVVEEDFTLPVIGIAAYAEGGFSLQSILGIPASCFFDLKVHGGQGYFLLLERDNPEDVCAGMKTLYGVSGRLLCLVNVRGDLAGVVKGAATISLNDLSFNSLSGSVTAKVKGTVGPCPFCYEFKRSVSLIVRLENPLPPPPDVTYSVDY